MKILDRIKHVALSVSFCIHFHYEEVENVFLLCSSFIRLSNNKLIEMGTQNFSLSYILVHVMPIHSLSFFTCSICLKNKDQWTLHNCMYCPNTNYPSWSWIQYKCLEVGTLYSGLISTLTQARASKWDLLTNQ